MRKAAAYEDRRVGAGGQFFVRRARQGGPAAERKKMIDPSAKLSVSRQAIVLGISRGSVYYQPRPVSVPNLKLMHRIDKLHMDPLCQHLTRWNAWFPSGLSGI